MSQAEIIGSILGTRESTPLDFWVGVEEGQYIQLDDVVFIETQHPQTGSPLRFYGQVDEVQKKLEGLNFDADTAMVQQGILPASLSHIAHVTITRIDPEIFIPPHPGETVYRANRDHFDTALSFDQMDHRLPAGLLQSGEPAFLNFDFIDGTKGGHVSISGISGVATKTSYTLFLLHGILNGPTIPKATRKNTHAIIFNVKNEDLLFLDQPNTKLKIADREAYAKLGLPAEPFQDVAFYAPCASAQGEIVPGSKTRPSGVQAYGWTLKQIAQENLLPYLFSETNQATSNLSFVVDIVSSRLWEMQREAEKKQAKVMYTLDGFNARISSLRDLVDHLYRVLDEEEQEEAIRHWFGRNASGTQRAFLRRLESVVKHMARFVRQDFTAQHQVQWREHHLSVIDINELHARAQMFVVGAILKQIFEYKSETGDKSPVFIILDELNRYAPRQGYSPIKEMLLDIAERGRSMGLILLGAQQTASEVEKRVVANAAIRINGRLDAAESGAREYGYLLGAFRQRSLMIRPGTMIVQQPELPTPILVNYPMPAWATRQSEVDPARLNSAGDQLSDDDLFARLQG